MGSRCYLNQTPGRKELLKLKARIQFSAQEVDHGQSDVQRTFYGKYSSALALLFCSKHMLLVQSEHSVAKYSTFYVIFPLKSHLERKLQVSCNGRMTSCQQITFAVSAQLKNLNSLPATSQFFLITLSGYLHREKKSKFHVLIFPQLSIKTLTHFPDSSSCFHSSFICPSRRARL